ncbi:hypothetical protein MMC32_001438 [Xylographa parallela]|nr:hypothetical protein [Xylographa parallela]
MATYIAQAHPPANSHQEFPRNTPPGMFHENNVSHRGDFAQVVPNGIRNHNRMSAEYRGNGTSNGSKAIPSGPQLHGANGGPRNFGPLGGGAFDGPRSPPNTKNTSHVPCKFFKIGQCQAGKACPFLHTTDTSKFETPCKYFAKGNCKFGPKCALLHILPNGQVVNRPNRSMGSHLNLGGRVDPMAYHHQESVLGNSLLAQQANGLPSPFSHQYPMADVDSTLIASMQPQPYENAQPLDIRNSVYPDSKYGSPRDDSRMPLSPVMHLSTLDAPLPASFDSQGISYIARHGPVAASVPSKFGLESPPSSLPKKTLLPSDALRNLYDSAFGGDHRLRAPNFGSSPSAPTEEYTGQRMMHSQRVTRPKMLSASLPRPGASDDWDNDILFGGEEDYLPSNLTHLLNADEKTRRFSGREQDPTALREGLSGHGTPAEISSKAGSPSTASPSRFTALFTKQKRDEESNGLSSSTFGHVGSPLRNSSLHLGTSPSFRAVSRPTSGDLPLHVASPPRQGAMSTLSQQLQRTRLARNDSSDGSSSLHPITARQISNPASRLDRAISSSSIHKDRIDEEECVFSLDEDEYNGNRPNGIWGQSNGTKSPNLGPIGGGRQFSGVHIGDVTKSSSNGVLTNQRVP